jgi:hypothetical protein
MTIQKLASTLCKLEGKKSQIKIGDMREALRLLCDLEAKAYTKAGKWRKGKSPAAQIFLAGNKTFHKGKPSDSVGYMMTGLVLK